MKKNNNNPFNPDYTGYKKDYPSIFWNEQEQHFAEDLFNKENIW